MRLGRNKPDKVRDRIEYQDVFVSGHLWAI